MSKREEYRNYIKKVRADHPVRWWFSVLGAPIGLVAYFLGGLPAVAGFTFFYLVHEFSFWKLQKKEYPEEGRGK